MISLQFNNTICERDMDLLFVESVLTDNGFCKMLIDKTDLKGMDYQILEAELSKTDSDLGESDITVIIYIEGKRYGLLIEDKIEAMAMPKQHERYIERGKKGIKNNEYDDFRVFLFCPEKYYNNNDEAKLYEHLLTYDECIKYFESKDDLLSILRRQQLEQALNKAKKPSSINVNEKANAFLRQYINYQKKKYPSLNLTTKEDKNGWWTEFRTELGHVYINHKIQEGYVDLVFPRAADQIDRAKTIAEWVRQHKISNVSVIKTKISVIFRVHVPKIDMCQGFDYVDMDELNQCFEAIKELTEFANVIEMVNLIALR